MPDILSDLKVTICQHCGDEGFSNAFVYCVECLNFAVHRYCLHQLPPTFDEFVYWACKDCKQIKKSKKTSLVQEHESILLNKEDDRSPKHADLDHYKENSNKECDAVSLDAEKVEGKIQEPRNPLIPEAPTTPIESEVKNSTSDGIDSQTKEDEHKTSQTPNKKPKRKRNSLTLRKKKRRQAVIRSVVNKGDEEHTRENPSKLAEMVSNSPSEEELKEKKDGLSDEEEEKRKADPTELAELVSNSSQVKEELKKKKDGLNEEIYVTNSMSTDVVLLGDDQPAIEEMPTVPVNIGKHVEEPKLEKEHRLVEFDGGCGVSQVDKEGNYVPLNYLAHAKPVIDPIWRGNFITGNKKYDTEDGFVAHLSSKACPKVWAEASLFPHSLCLEILPKADLWPKSFQASPPTDDNIALYFFPADKSNEKVFDQLVEELMRKEVAMRSTVQNAELLIFASMELPVPHWRFQGKYYLWGVFRGKQANPSNPANQLPTTNSGTRKEKNLEDRANPSNPANQLPTTNSGTHKEANLADTKGYKKRKR